MSFEEEDSALMTITAFSEPDSCALAQQKHARNGIKSLDKEERKIGLLRDFFKVLNSSEQVLDYSHYRQLIPEKRVVESPSLTNSTLESNDSAIPAFQWTG